MQLKETEESGVAAGVAQPVKKRQHKRSAVPRLIRFMSSSPVIYSRAQLLSEIYSTIARGIILFSYDYNPIKRRNVYETEGSNVPTGDQDPPR